MNKTNLVYSMVFLSYGVIFSLLYYSHVTYVPYVNYHIVVPDYTPIGFLVFIIATIVTIKSFFDDRHDSKQLFDYSEKSATELLHDD